MVNKKIINIYIYIYTLMLTRPSVVNHSFYEGFCNRESPTPAAAPQR